MKKPENFKKIDNVEFVTRTGNKYKFSASDFHTELWVFKKPDNTKYVLAFIIDWENGVYEIKRAENGQGTNWIDVLHQGNFSNEPMKTMMRFVDWAHHRVIQLEYYFDKL